MKKFFTTLLLAISCVQLVAAPVYVWGSKRAPRLHKLLEATLFQPQWTSDTPEKKLFNGKDFNDAAAVLYVAENATLKFEPGDEPFLSRISKFVSDGGTFIYLADGAPVPKKISTGTLAKLFGADKWQSFTGKAEIKDARFAECGKIPEVFKHMLFASAGEPRAALGALRSSARVLIGNSTGALAVENRFGKGRVFFINIRLTESFTNYQQPYHNCANAALEQLFPFMKAFHSMLADAGVKMVKSKREIWDNIPLGKAEKIIARPPRTPKKLISNRKFEALEGTPLTLVKAGQPQACIVNAPRGIRGAADRFNALIKKISKTELPVVSPDAVSEKDGVWLWRKKSFQVKIEFKIAEKIQISARGNLISISAPDAMIGFQTFMREALGYRMLWPGELGEVYKVSSDISIKPFTLSDAPFIKQRYLRNTRARAPIPWKTPEGKTIKIKYDKTVLNAAHLTTFDPRVDNERHAGHDTWNAPNRLGGNIAEAGGVSFYHWRKVYGKKYPKLFALQFDGLRRSGTSHIRICKSNPDAVKIAAAEAAEKLAKTPGVRYYRLSPSDGSYDIFCMCPQCRTWDPADAPRKTARVFLTRNRPVFPYVPMTDRVLRFTCEFARELAKTNPDVQVQYLAYADYLTPPQIFNDIPDNLFVSVVAVNYLDAKYLAYSRRCWDYWSTVAGELRWRPNLFLGGKGLPFIYTSELAKDIKHFASTGMIAGDFSSNTHCWATQGLNYYVLAQLLWDPSQSLDSVIDDYCRSGFGKAADLMKQYFAEVEKLTTRFANNSGEDAQELEDLTATASNDFFHKFIRIYTPEKIAMLQDILNRAKAQLPADSIESRRIDFVASGLEYSRLTTGFWRKFYATPKSARTKLIPEIDALVEKWHQQMAKYPFAVNIPYFARDNYYQFFRDCKWKPGKLR